MRALLFRIIYFFVFFGTSTIAGILIPFLQYKGFDPIQTGSLISLFTLSGLVGLFSIGYFCDKLKTIKQVLLYVKQSTTKGYLIYEGYCPSAVWRRPSQPDPDRLPDAFPGK